MTRHGRWCWQSIVALIAIAVCVSMTRSADAQDFKVIAPRIDGAQVKVLSGQVATILRDPAAPGAPQLKQLDDFFKGALYPSMTNIDPEALGQLATKREQLFQRYINAAKSQAARDHLNTMTLQVMSSIAKGPYHPAVRYNAALILGQIDAQAGVKPLPAGTEALLSLLENEAFNKLTVPTAVKVGAIIGLQRHTRLGVDPALGERITKAALAVANREELPDDASAKAYGWVRRQAAKVLAKQFEKGLTPPVYESFVRLIVDEKSDLDDRCAVAELLTPDMFANAKDLDHETMALALGGLARKVLALEAEEAEEYLDETVGGGVPSFGEGGGRGAFGGEGMYRGGSEGGGMDFASLGMEDLGPKYEKRRMIDRTIAIVDGAKALQAGSSDELKERLTEFADTILAVAEAAAPENAGTTEITSAVVKLEKNVSRMVTDWAPAKPGADEAAAEEEAELELPEEAPAEDPGDAPADAPAEAPADVPAAEEAAPPADAAEPAEAAEPAAG
jgi:hypothetical protein